MWYELSRWRLHIFWTLKIHISNGARGFRDGSVGINMCFSCRESQLSFQYPCLVAHCYLWLQLQRIQYLPLASMVLHSCDIPPHRDIVKIILKSFGNMKWSQMVFCSSCSLILFALGIYLIPINPLPLTEGQSISLFYIENTMPRVRSLVVLSHIMVHGKGHLPCTVCPYFRLKLFIDFSIILNSNSTK